MVHAVLGMHPTVLRFHPPHEERFGTVLVTFVVTQNLVSSFSANSTASRHAWAVAFQAMAAQVALWP